MLEAAELAEVFWEAGEKLTQSFQISFSGLLRLPKVEGSVAREAQYVQSRCCRLLKLPNESDMSVSFKQ